MSLKVEDLQQKLQGYVGQLNQLNQKVNEAVGSIKAIQALLSEAKKLNEQLTNADEQAAEQDVMQ